MRETIDGVVLKALKQIRDDRGYLMEMLRSDWPEFEKFGQVYVTVCKPGVAKAWHYHKEQTDHFVVVRGMARIALFDSREGSKTKGEVNEFVIGEEKPALLVIPKGVIHGFTSATKEDVCIVNVPDRLYDYKNPDEYRIPFDSKEIPFDWKCKKGG